MAAYFVNKMMSSASAGLFTYFFVIPTSTLNTGPIEKRISLTDYFTYGSDSNKGFIYLSKFFTF